MNFTKKFDRAFQWAGEKMGQEARTTTSDEFKMLETEMALRFDGAFAAKQPACVTKALTNIVLFPAPSRHDKITDHHERLRQVAYPPR